MRNSTFVKALWCCTLIPVCVNHLSVLLVIQVGSVLMEAPLSTPWRPVNTCFVCVVTVSRGNAVKQVRSLTANQFAFIFLTFLTKTPFCSFSKKRLLLRGHRTVLQRHSVWIREWTNMWGMGFGHQEVVHVFRCQFREAQLLQVSCHNSKSLYTVQPVNIHTCFGPLLQWIWNC